MGTSRRYADSVGAAISRRIEQVTDTRQVPLSLTDAELQKDRYQPTVARPPLPVTVWLRFADSAERVDAHAIAWTPKAVLVEWNPRPGAEVRVWVWASAVERRDPTQE